jgi:hypothetical protein
MKEQLYRKVFTPVVDGNGEIHEHVEEYVPIKQETENDFLQSQLELIKKENDILVEALDFYQQPETYFACSLFCDPPCGAISEDYSDCGEWGMRLGKTAREAIKKVIELEVQSKETPLKPS